MVRRRRASDPFAAALEARLRIARLVVPPKKSGASRPGTAWLFEAEIDGWPTKVVVEGPLWHEARQVAARHFGCAEQDVRDVTPAEELQCDE